MKIRNGFVSNSSSSSFTIYGWSEEVLSKHIGKLLPDFVGVEVSIDEDVFCENIEKIWAGHDWDILSFRDSNGCNIFGIGTAGDEVDHYAMDFFKDFKYDEPSNKKKKQLDEVAEKLGLPAPQVYQETFYA